MRNELLMEKIRHELKKANTAWEEKKAAGLGCWVAMTTA
eukprot:COSAG05_NODE_3291_length_2173_cov_2.521215_2_plen_38_part_01